MIDIFKTGIYEKKLDINNKKLLKYLLNLKKKSKGRTVSSPTGWQSEDLPLKEKVFSQIVEEIDKNFYEYIKILSLDYSKFQIGNMWCNMNGHKDYNLVHSHGDAVVSGVYYIKVPKDSGNIFFVNPALQQIEVNWKNCIKEYTNYNSSHFSIKSIEHYLLLFPSWLSHGVQPNLNKKENRVSMSFNITKC
jgi:uncharacterized protein (TIGR02466 family)|tara:strand:- start:742 stop:1314 length:573 start_codon:yes stop_codon:yes gene_type:complete